MKDIADLRRDRKAAADKMQESANALAALEAADGEPDAEKVAQAQTAFEAAQADFEKADAAVKRGEAVEAAQAASAGGATGDAGTTTATGATGIPARAKNPDEVGIETGFMVQAIANAKGDKEKAIAWLDKEGHSGISAALSGATEAAGGVTIPREQGREIIGLLKPRVAVRASGARVIPLPAGELRNARQTASASASYGAENSAAIESEPEFEPVSQSFRKLTGLVPIGNSLLRHASPELAMLVRDDLVDALALREDLAFIRADGSANQPVGLRTWALDAHWLATVDTTAGAVEAAVRGAVSRVEDANVAMINPGWIMRASAKNFLAALRNPTTGYKVFPSIDDNGTLMGYPIKVTSQIPDNLAIDRAGGAIAGADGTEVYFADFNEIMIGDALAITLAASTEAAFVNGSGDTVSAFQNDLTLMRAISEHDMVPRHDEAIAGFNAAGWAL